MRGVRDRVQPVEGVGEIDDAALLADGGDRLAHGQAARDLLAEEEADHLALAVGLHLLAGDDRAASRPRASSTASSAPEKTLWSVTAIAPSPIRSAWSRRSATGTAQSCECSVCMWRSARIIGRSAERVGGRRAARRRRSTAP